MVWKGFKWGLLGKVEIVCRQCHKTLCITPRSLWAILALLALLNAPIIFGLIHLAGSLQQGKTLWVLLLLMPINLALLIFLYLKLARFREQHSTQSITP